METSITLLLLAPKEDALVVFMLFAPTEEELVFLLAPTEEKRVVFDVADCNKARCCCCVDTATLSDGGGHCYSRIANGENRATIARVELKNRATIARVELGAFAGTRSAEGDCGNNTVAFTQANLDGECLNNSVCLTSKRSDITNKSSDESQTFYTTNNSINESVDELQTFNDTCVLP